MFTYTTMIEAANSIAHKNGVDIGTAMMWVRMGIADGTIQIMRKSFVTNGNP